MFSRPLHALIAAAIFLAATTCKRPSASAPTTYAPLADGLPQYICHRTPSAIAIDGKLTDPAWSAAPWTSDLINILGPDHPAPELRTRCKLLYDDKNLYIAAELQEPHVWGTITQKNSKVFLENAFEFFLDPAGAGQNYWEFEINPRNTIWTLMMDRPYSQGGQPIPGTELKNVVTAVAVQGTLNNPSDQDQGWTVEIAVPWSDIATANLTTPPKNGDDWRCNLARVEYDPEIHDGQYSKSPGKSHWSSLSPMLTGDLHQPHRFAHLRFSN